MRRPLREAHSAGNLIPQVLRLLAQKAFGIDYLGKPIFSEGKGENKRNGNECFGSHKMRKVKFEL